MQTVTGIITPHRGRGTRLGVPTINLPAPADIPDGVY
ncbi:MAG TPA: bifunctional riboflavin kinase/FAD synthetase, partial [Candidatus Kerfeldbacteria bacterium]|nr:bifunctional riboflavin kinase/FAD synthetase [Candidatus Kerfeldbacteria bacterium]